MTDVKAHPPSSNPLSALSVRMAHVMNGAHPSGARRGRDFLPACGKCGGRVRGSALCSQRPHLPLLGVHCLGQEQLTVAVGQIGLLAVSVQSLC